METKAELLPTKDEDLLAELQVPEFTPEQIAFFKALITITQKERLGLPLDPDMKPQYLMAHASLVGKEDNLQWIMDSALSIQDTIARDGYPPIVEKKSLTPTDEELSVIAAGFDD